MRRAQTTVEYLMTISVVSIAIIFVLTTMMEPFPSQVVSLGQSLGTSLTEDGIQR